MLPEQQQRILGYFIEEARDHLNTIEQGLLSLQSTLSDSEMINEVFRAAHSIKGGAAMLGLSSIQHTSHRLEDCFKVLKERPNIQVDQKLESLFLGVSDTLKALLEHLTGPFGLTEEVANTLMSEAEPVFGWLNEHLSMLVQQLDGGGKQTTIKSLETKHDEIKPVDDKPFEKPKATPVISIANNCQEFQAKVLQKLREMLQVFKQSPTAENRKILQLCCEYLTALGSEYDYPNWSVLCQDAANAIVNTDNSYLTLAKVVITEIKQALELVIQNRQCEITASSQLQELIKLPKTESLKFENTKLENIQLETHKPEEKLESVAPIITEVQPTSQLFIETQIFPQENIFASDFTETSVQQNNTIIFVHESLESPELEEDNLLINLDPNGPEVGLAELNTLADLFEGESPDLDESWQEEEVIEAIDTAEINLNKNKENNKEADSDLADLLGFDNDFNANSRQTTTTPREELTLVQLFGDDFVDDDFKSEFSKHSINQADTQKNQNIISNHQESKDDNKTTEFLQDLVDTDLQKNNLHQVLDTVENKNLQAALADAEELISFGELLGSQEEIIPDILNINTPSVITKEDNLTSEKKQILRTNENDDLDDLSNFFDTPISTNDYDPNSSLDDDFNNFWQIDNAQEEIETLSEDIDIVSKELDNSLFIHDDNDLFGDNINQPEILDIDISLDYSDDLFTDLLEPSSAGIIGLAESDLYDTSEGLDLQPEFSNISNEINSTIQIDVADNIPSKAKTTLDNKSDVPEETSNLDLNITATNISFSSAASVENNLDLSAKNEISNDGRETILYTFDFEDEDNNIVVSLHQDKSDNINDDFLINHSSNFPDIPEENNYHFDAFSIHEVKTEVSEFIQNYEEEISGKIEDNYLTENIILQSKNDITDLGSDNNNDLSKADDLESFVNDNELDIEINELDIATTDLSYYTKGNSSDLDNLKINNLENLSDDELEIQSTDLNFYANRLENLSAHEIETESANFISLDNLYDTSVDELKTQEFQFQENESQESLNINDGEIFSDLNFGLNETSQSENLSENSLKYDFHSKLDNNFISHDINIIDDKYQNTFLNTADEIVNDTAVNQEEIISPMIEEIEEIDEFADLEALLATETYVAESDYIPDEEFAGLEALLNLVDDEVEVTSQANNITSASSFSGIDLGYEFDDLEKLLAEADLSSTPTAKTNSTKNNRNANRRTAAKFEQTMRVPVKHLDDMSNLVGELVVNRNTLEQDQEKMRQSLDNLLHQVQQLSDVGARMQELYERSLLEASLLASRRNGFSGFQAPPESDRGFSELEMDRFTPFHSLSQEMIELIVRVRESASDIDFVTEESERVARQFRQVTTQLQEGLTRARMVPFAQATDRLQRGVRDNAIKSGKQIELIIEGRDTLIDKMILEHLTDPLTHMLNNAIAHGIETPEERLAMGKQATGLITVRAFHQGNQTIISVGDDGAGINSDKVKAKAIKVGMITPDQAKLMSRIDVYDLLFQAGFSIKDQADELAGRGVGMDVVRSSITEIRGIINTDSQINKGTTFTIRLPLTLSICKSLCCVSDKARIAFPMDGVEDTLDIPLKNIQMSSSGEKTISWRDTLLPVKPLKELLTLNRHLSRGNVYSVNRDDDMLSIVVIRSGNSFLALQVDQVLNEQEIVIKQFEPPAPKPIGVAGATILGDGRIMPIADVLEIIDIFQGRTNKQSAVSLWEQQKNSSTSSDTATTKIDPTVLIVDDSITVRELLSLTFNKAGYRVEQARDGQEAWDKLRSGLPCDIVFCDIEMPRCDGLELLSRIQKEPSLNHLPIAMLTSRGADKHRQMAIQLGASGYFTKPYLEEALLEAANRMLRGEKLVISPV
jgi:chemotaxis protein histidine kinase CheA/CheY-like chemotaxis protein